MAPHIISKPATNHIIDRLGVTSTSGGGSCFWLVGGLGGGGGGSGFRGGPPGKRIVAPHAGHSTSAPA